MSYDGGHVHDRRLVEIFNRTDGLMEQLGYFETVGRGEPCAA